MLPSRAAGGITQPSSSSGIFFQGDGHTQLAGNSQLSSLTGHARPSSVPFPGDANNAVLNSVANSAPSVGANSSITDANSVRSGGSHMQRSASFNNESYMRLPASPMSFTSNNINISGSSVLDGSSVLQQSSNQDACLQAQQGQQHQGVSNATSLTTSRMGQFQIPGGVRGANSFMQDPNTISQLQKKSHLDIKQEDILQQQVLQQLLQRNDQVHSQNSDPQLQALIQQQRLRQQREHQQLLQSVPPIQRVQLLQQQQQQQQLREQLIQQGMQPASGIKRSYDGGVCSRQLMQYLYHQRQRPAENTIAYWRKFVTEYYSPRAKKRWCLTLYDNVGNHSLGVFPQAAVDAWQCDICGSKSGRGFEATFEVLPRLDEIKFASGVIDELLFLDLPREYRFPSGMMMLEYAKAVQESVYDQLRVVREGQLRIIFTPDLKILSWEFCARCHEELLPCRLVAPQAKQLLQVAQKCQITLSDCGSDGVSQQDLQANSVMVVTAGRQLTRSLELQSLNDLGFSKRYVRCLQISEVVSSMKDLMDFCTQQKVGPVEGLKNYPRHASATKVQMQKIQEMEQAGATSPADCNSLNKLMAIQNNNQQLVGFGGDGDLAGSALAALALTNYQNLLIRQNSMNTMHNNSLQQHQASSAPFVTSSQALTPPISSGTASAGTQNPSGVGFSSGQTLQQQQQTHSLPSQSSQALQQQMIQQLLHDMNNNNNAQQSLSGQNQGGNVSRDGLSYRSSAGNGSANMVGNPPNRMNCYKSEINAQSLAAPGNSGFSLKSSDLSQNLHLPDDLVADIAREFTDNGFFDTDLDDNINVNWKT